MHTQEFDNLGDAQEFVADSTSNNIRKGNGDEIVMTVKSGTNTDDLRAALARLSVSNQNVTIAGQEMTIRGKDNLRIMANNGFEFAGHSGYTARSK